MIKFMMKTSANKMVLGLILSRENLNRLPTEVIHFTAGSLKLSEIRCDEIMIAFYETEEDAERAFERGGLINAHTEIVKDPTAH